MTVTQAAKWFGMNRGTVQRWLSKEGLKPNDGRGRLLQMTQSDWKTLQKKYAKNAGYAAPKSPPKDETPPDPIEQSLEKDLLEQKRQVRKLSVELGDRRRLESKLIDAVPKLPVPAISYRPKTTTGKSQATPVICLNDMHAGNQASPISLIERRMSYLRQKFGEWIEDQRHAYTLDDVHVFGLGDYIEGGLRESAKQSNSEQEPEQAIEAGNLISKFCLDLTTQFRHVNLSLVLVDNHSRIDPKLNFEQIITRSWNWVTEKFIRARLDQSDRVSVHAPHDFACWVQVERTRFLNIHGNGIRMHRRTPYYGIDDRYALERATRQGTDTEFDRMNLAHFHHGASGNGWDLFPPMIGTTGYDRGSGRETHPAQGAFLVSPKYKPPFCKVTFDLEHIT